MISHTPLPVRTVALAGRICRSGKPYDELVEELSDERAAEFVRKLIRQGHFSVLEHAYFTFWIEGITRACSHQLVRHRIASYSQASQRAGNLPVEMVLPNKLHGKAKVSSLLMKVRKTYEQLVMDGVKPEDARAILPQATTTRLVVTMNARSLHNFFDLRLCRHAQAEIRELAQEMLRHCKRVAGPLFETAGTPCFKTGKCRDGGPVCY